MRGRLYRLSIALIVVIVISPLCVLYFRYRSVHWNVLNTQWRVPFSCLPRCIAIHPVKVASLMSGDYVYCSFGY